MLRFWETMKTYNVGPGVASQNQLSEICGTITDNLRMKPNCGTIGREAVGLASPLDAWMDGPKLGSGTSNPRGNGCFPNTNG